MGKRGRRILMWGGIAAAIVVVLFALAVLITNLVITRSTTDSIIRSPEEAPRAQAAIVLGARVYADGTPSPMLQDRLDTGIKLYKLGKVDKLLLSGDHGQTDYDEVNTMLAYVLARGVPTWDVFTDHAGFDTYDTMYRAIDVFRVRSALIVTQEFHLARSVYTAQTLGLDCVGVVADIQPYGDETRNRMREWLARGKAIFQLHISHPEPRFLGPPIPIDGDGRATRG
jgi:vancomycin permeability regulator SanA